MRGAPPHPPDGPLRMASQCNGVVRHERRPFLNGIDPTSMNTTADRLSPPQLQRTVRDTGGAGSSYMVSSQDLRSGLEVNLLAMTQLPVELLRELVRLHGCWPGDAGRSGHRLAA